MSDKYSTEICAHCSLVIPTGVNVSSKISTNSEPSRFCCYGCKLVFELIHKQGLQDFYNQRDGISGQLLVESSLNFLKSMPANLSSENIAEKVFAEYRKFDEPVNQARFLFTNEEQNLTSQRCALIEIEGMTCAACGWLNEHYLAQKSGVIAVNVNMATNQMLVEFDIAQIRLSQLLSAIKSLGYIPHSVSADNKHLQIKASRSIIWKLFIAGFGMMQSMSFSAPLYFSSNNISEVEVQVLRWTTLIIITPVLLFAGRDYFVRSINDLLRKNLSMDIPIALGLALGYLHSAYNTFAAVGEYIYLDSIAMLLFFLLCGKFFELRAHQKVTTSLYGKLRQEEKFAYRLLGNRENEKYQTEENVETEEVAIEELKAGEKILIKHGSVIVCDGTLISANSAELDESMLSGEARPVEKFSGDFINAGAINRGDAFVMQLQNGGGARGRVRQEIELLVAKALNEKPKFIKSSIYIARYFIFVLLLLSISTFIYWYIYADINMAIKITIALLVITCPCALALAAPLTLSALMAVLLNRGAILQNPAVLEKSHKLSKVILDKTGTITKGNLTVQKIVVNKFTNWQVKSATIIAAKIEQNSEHPIAKAFSEYQKRHLQTDNINCQNIIRHPSQGLSADIVGSPNINGLWHIGNKDFCAINSDEDTFINSQLLNDEINKTIIYLAQMPTTKDGKIERKIAVFVLDDEIHQFVGETISTWQKLSLQINILSGDRRQAVLDLAKKLSIMENQVFAEVSPQEKMEFVQKQKAEGEVVMMVGDGVNDAPVLAVADISVGMPSASDLSKISADVILLKGQSPWERIAQILPIMQKARKILWQNYIWAGLYNIVMIPLAMMGLVNPWVAGLGMTISSLVVLFNSMRLFRE